MSNLERTTSLPARIDELQAEEEKDLGLRKLRRSSSMPVPEGRVRSFPPPLGSMARKTTSPSQMLLPLSRLRTVRCNGRIVLHEVKIPNQMTLHTVRHQGRLVLNLVRCKENAPPPSEEKKSTTEKRSIPVEEEEVSEVTVEQESLVVPQPVQSDSDSGELSEDDRTQKVEKAEEEEKEEKEKSKFRADHAHMLQELMAAYATRAMKQMSCNRPVVWDHNHHFHCVTTSS